MARENITISIKGDIKDLEQKINQSKAVINESVKSISAENSKLTESQQKVIDAQKAYADEIKNTKNEINKYVEIKSKNGKLSKEEREDLAKARASLALLKDKTKELVDIEKEKVAQTRQNINANKNLLDSQKVSIDNLEKELKAKQKVLEFEDKYRDSIRESNRLVNEKLKAGDKERENLRSKVLLYGSLEAKINSYTQKTNELEKAFKKKIITTDEYRKSLKILNQELAKSTGVDKFGYSNRAISSGAISKGVGIKESADAEAEATEKSINAQKEYAKQLEKNKQKEKEYAKAKYETVTSLLAQKRAQEQLEKDLKINAQKEKARMKEEYVRRYENTHAQNAYNDAVKHLNTLKKAGVISSRQYESALAQEKQALKESELAVKAKTKATSSLANETIRYLRWAGTIAGVVYAGERAWRATIGTGIEVNKIIESNTYGIAALTSANTRMTDTLGNSLTPMQKFVKGQELAKGVLENLREEAVKTYATFPQLIEIFQQATGQTLGMGNAFGETIDEINKNTVQLASRMSNIAGAIGMPMDRVREEIRSLLSANASTDSLISTMIFGSPSQANEAVRNAKKSVNGLADLLDEKLKPFDILADTKSFQKSVLMMQDSWQRAMSDMVEKSKLFEDITNLFYDVAEDLKDNNEEIAKSFDAVYGAVKNVADIIGELAVPAGIVGGIYAVSAASKVLTATVIALTAAVRANPLFFGGVAIATSIGYVANAISNLREEEEKSQKELKKRLASPEMQEKRIQADLKNLEEKKKQIQASIDAWSKYAGTQKAVNDKKKEMLEVDQKILALQNKSKAIKDSQEQVKSLKQVGELMASYSYSKEAEEKVNERLKESESKLVALNKEKASHLSLAKEHEKEIERAKKVQKQDAKYIAMIEAKRQSALEAAKLAESAITEEKQKQKDDENRKNKLAEKRRRQNTKAWAEELSIKKQLELYELGMADSENLKISRQQIKIAGLGAEWQATKNTKDANKILLEIYEKSAVLNDQIAKAKEKQTREDEKQAILKFKNTIAGVADADTLNVATEKMLQDFEGDYEATEKIKKAYEKAFKDLKPIKIGLELEGVDEVSKTAASIANIFSDLNDKTEQYNYLQQNILTKEKDKEKATADYKRETISGYGQIAGAMSSMFKQGSREAEAFTRVQAALAMVNAVNAVVQAAAAPPPIGFASMAAMAASVATVLANANIAFSGLGGTSTSTDAFSAMKENTGAGTVLGDVEAQSESIANAMSVLEDFAQPQFSVLSQMNKYLESIDSKMGGISALIYQNAGFAVGEGFVGSSKQVLSVSDIPLVGDVFGAVDSLLSGLTGGLFDGLIGGVLNKVLGGIFGKTKRSLTDAGIFFGEQLITSAIEAIEGSAYQTITTTKKSWFKKSSSTSTYFDELDDETERQFSLVLDNLYRTVLLSGEALDTQSTQIEKDLEDFVVNIGKISLKDKTADEIQEQITAVFGQIGDDLAKDVFPLLSGFQKVGEGMFETMTRVSVGMEEAGYYISRLGSAFSDLSYLQIENQQGDVGFEALLQSIVGMEESSYGTNNNLVQIIENLDATTEELYITYNALDKLRDRVKFLGQDINGLSSSMIYGAGSVEALTGGFDSYFENFLTDSEQLSYQIIQLQDEFTKLNIAMPNSKEAFTDLLNSIDLTTESGQELYGRLIMLSEEFANVSDEVEKSIDTLKNSLEEDLSGFKNIVDGVNEISNSFIDAISSISKTIETLLGNKTGADTSSAQIEKYWQKRSEVEALLAKGSDISTLEVNELNSLISEISGLSTSIQSEYSDNEVITSNLVSDLMNIQSRMDFSKEILKVNIVEGLGALLGLNENQLEQLKESVSNDNITKAELENINTYSVKQWEELFSVNNNGISVTDAQIEGLKTLSEEQKEELVNANSDNRITNNELQKIGGLTSSQYYEIAKINNNGISVTDAQIEGLTTLSNEQKKALLKANNDDEITIKNLKSIVGLTEVQKDGIVEFAKKSEQISTEDTLWSLNQYAKKQLETIQSNIEEETASLSAKTFTYGDYIGKQEQIDIAEKLGVSYETVKPLIEQLQTLGVSKNIESDVTKMLGYEEGSLLYDESKASSIKALSEYLSPEISGAVTGVESKVAEKKEWQREKAEFENKYSMAQADYAKEVQEKDEALSMYDRYFNASLAWKGSNYFERQEDLERNIPFYREGWVAYTGANRNSMLEWSSIYSREFKEASEAYVNLKNLEELKNLKGFSSGGYTGKGGKYEIAGFTHKNEHIIKSEEVDAIGGEYAIKQMISREIMSKKNRNTGSSASFDYSNNKNGIIEELKKGQEMLEKGFGVLASQIDELIDFNEERRSEGYKTEVVGKVTAIAG